jgi:Domain of unknown function (DUF4270)
MELCKSHKNAYLLKAITFFVFTLSILVISCSENPNEFTLGEEFIDSQTNLSLIDTFSVILSTVILDSVVSNATGEIFVGSYMDDYIGKISSNGFFQIGIPENYDSLDLDEVYDSLSLIIIYNHKYYGDTTKIQNIAVHQLTESIEYTFESNITNQTTFNYNSNPIGEITYFPKPHDISDTLFIKISDEIGLDLFNKLKEKSETLTSNARFLNYFHGLVLKADETNEGAIVGFDANEGSISLILHTKREDIIIEKNTYDFDLYIYEKQFNNVSFDLSTTQLNKLTEQRTELVNSETNGLSFLQGGVGLAIRVNFPSMDELLLFNRGTLMEAKLSISPLLSANNDDDFIENLLVYETNNLNYKNELLLNGQGDAVVSSFNNDELYQEETAYTFDVTSFISGDISDSYVDPESGLLITFPTRALESSFNRLIVDAQNKNTNLKIYYLTY